jgi:hypothetical protein
MDGWRRRRMDGGGGGWMDGGGGGWMEEEEEDGWMDTSFFEDRKTEFGRANLLVTMDELKLENVIGHGEFGG